MTADAPIRIGCIFHLQQCIFGQNRIEWRYTFLASPLGANLRASCQLSRLGDDCNRRHPGHALAVISWKDLAANPQSQGSSEIGTIALSQSRSGLHPPVAP
jgi:hypothetical protein